LLSLVDASSLVAGRVPERRQFQLEGKGVTAVTRIMNVDEVARYLGVVPDTIYRKARRGEIPAVKVGKMWRFPKETLDKWLNDAALGTMKKS
jgi:excisionase family DNA binding protein